MVSVFQEFTIKQKLCDTSQHRKIESYKNISQ